MLIYTNYVKYIRYFNERSFTNLSHTLLYNITYVKMMKYITYMYICIIYLSNVYY